jgi:AhpD family alkylhydroperoxidase
MIFHALLATQFPFGRRLRMMKTPAAVLAALMCALAVPVVFAAGAEKKPDPKVQAAYKDIEATLGSVPGFFKAFPPEAIPAAWAEMKAVQMDPNSPIPGKNRDLIALGVAAQIPCKYCVYFHTVAAKTEGASEDEIKLALAEASLTRYWSTYLNGVRVDEVAFRAEVDRAVTQMKSGATKPAPIEVTDEKSAFRDIEQTYGFVPTFMREFPAGALPAAWNEMKAVEMNPSAPISGKYLSLESLAIASQVPCGFCTYADTSFAKAQGASDAELKEAVLLSAEVRHWSTYLNGIDYDDAKFRHEVDQVFATMKKRQAALESKHASAP